MRQIAWPWWIRLWFALVRVVTFPFRPITRLLARRRRREEMRIYVSICQWLDVDVALVRPPIGTGPARRGNR